MCAGKLSWVAHTGDEPDNIQARILRVGQRQPHAAHSDGVQHSQLSAGRHKRLGAEVSQKALSERRRLGDKRQGCRTTARAGTTAAAAAERGEGSPAAETSGSGGRTRAVQPPHTVPPPPPACSAPSAPSGTRPPSDSISVPKDISCGRTRLPPPRRPGGAGLLLTSYSLWASSSNAPGAMEAILKIS